MTSASKYYKPRKKNGRTLEVPLAHAMTATEAHLRALSIINDDEDVSMEFTPNMVRINITKPPIGGVTKEKGQARKDG